ncbi:hypothetical protein H3S88_09475 [Gilliamella sp. B14448G11]|uniref:hypothetical protein n=1 Tax=unclassified Gilliamella TaxID=2685620 RepID=UPI0018DDF9BE|nr:MULTISPECIES: hypothetical protein [unclassified Gilliamella]MBI0029046.1 hypothetical protein [Gilliamella sp. B14448G7]MBI0035899.1 hypothetical protein [Gilliamella sp. B14448G11]MBI0043241.1 hypothetical protein [Gilliamella sp. B14448G12]
MSDMAKAVASSMPPASILLAAAEVGEATWCLYKEKDPKVRSQAKFQLLMGIISFIPGIGGGFRLALKSLIKKPDFYGPIIFDLSIAIIEETNKRWNYNYPLNPEGYLRKLIDAPYIRKYLNEIRIKYVAQLRQYKAARWVGLPETVDSVLGELSNQLEDIIRNVLAPAVLAAINRALHRKNSARPSNVTTKKTNTTTSTNTKKTNTTNKGSSKPTVTRSRGNLIARIRSKFPNITSAIGGVGEHIADYYCLEHLDWGKDQWDGHDKAQKGTWKKLPSASNLGKLNNLKKLKRNSTINNETGIDGFWRAKLSTNQGKKYAVVEAKATTEVARATTKYVASRLGVLSGSHNNKPIVQMDHYWIGQRIKRELAQLGDDIKRDFGRFGNIDGYKRMYTRHIIIVSLSVDPGLSHINALLNGNQSALTHSNHGKDGFVIHKFGEPTIENIILEKHRSLENKKGTNKQKKPNKK